MNQCIPRLAKPALKSKPNHRLVSASLLVRFREALLRMIMMSAASNSPHEEVDRDRELPDPRRQQLSYCSYYQDRYNGEAVADCIEFIKKKASSDEDDDG